MLYNRTTIMIGKIFRLFSSIVLPRLIIIGVDFQDRHIAAVASERKGDKVTVLGSNVVELPDAAIQDGEIQDSTLVSAALDELMKGMPSGIFEKLKSEPVFVISIPPHHIYTEAKLFPILDEADLEGAVRLKIETSLPWPITQTYFDWVKIPVREKNRSGVFIAAVSKNTVDGFLNLFVNREWRVAACEFHILSLTKFIQKETTPFIFASIDEDGIEFAIFNNGLIVMHYLQKVHSVDDLPILLKEKITQLAAFAEGSLNVQVQNVFVLDKFRIVPLGGIAEDVHIPVREFPDFTSERSDLVIAHGASQREYSSVKLSLNLLPSDATGRYHENLIIKTLGLWMKLLAVFSAVFIVGFFGILRLATNERTTVQRDVSALGATVDVRVADVAPLVEEANSFNELVQNAQKLLQIKSSVNNVIAEIDSIAFKNGVTITHLKSGDRGEITMAAFAPARENATNFQSQLEASNYFYSASIPISDLAPERNLTINVILKLS